MEPNTPHPPKQSKPLNLTTMSLKYGDGYVARLQGTTQVIAHAKRADELMEKIRDTEAFKKKKLVISWVPKHDTTYVFHFGAGLPTGLRP